MNRRETLDSAKECVLKDRQATHGEPEDSFSVISKMWSAYLGVEIKPHEVAILMGLLKVARMRGNPTYDDNYVDLAGYAACAAELATKGVISPTHWNPAPPKTDMLEPAKSDSGLNDDTSCEVCAQRMRDLSEGHSPAPLPSSVLRR